MKGNRWKGSMTVELTIIMPIVLLTILGILSLCLTHYQNIVTGVAAMEAANRGAVYWDMLGEKNAWILDGEQAGRLRSLDYSEHDPYRVILDSKFSTRTANIAQFAKWRLSQNPEVALGTESTSDPEVTLAGFGGDGFGLFQKYVTVSVKKQYINPLDRLLENLGIKQESERVITASAPMNRQAELIRTITLIYDQIRQPGYKGD